MRRRDKERRSRIGGELVLAMRIPEIPAVGRVGFRLVDVKHGTGSKIVLNIPDIKLNK